MEYQISSRTFTQGQTMGSAKEDFNWASGSCPKPCPELAEGLS